MASLIPTERGKAAYSETVLLDGVVFTLRFRWNERAASWFLDVADVNGAAILSSIAVVTGVDLTSFRLAVDPKLPRGALQAVDTSGAGARPGFFDLGTRVLLAYLEAA